MAIASSWLVILGLTNFGQMKLAGLQRRLAACGLFDVLCAGDTADILEEPSTIEMKT
jgi:hypothetical protein